MQTTASLGLKKPEGTDVVNIDDFNYNADIIDGKIKGLQDGKVDKVTGKQLSTEDYTTVEKNKLNGIAAGAQPNQNAFSNVKVGTAIVAADNATDTLELVAGTNITLTPDATNDKVTIASTVPVATSFALGGVKSGTDITVDASGNVSVNDDSHNHVISNVDGLQGILDGKQATLPVENRRKITFGTADPTGGSDGDIYLQYE